MRWPAVALVVLWTFAFLVRVVAWSTSGARADGLAVLAAAGGAACALLVALRDAPQRFGTLPAAALLVLPFGATVAWQSWTYLLLFPPVLVLMGTDTRWRRWTWPDRWAPRVAVVIAAYVALAPVFEATLVLPPTPPGAIASEGVRLGEPTTEAFGGGEGSLRARPILSTAPEGDVVVSIVAPAGTPLAESIAEGFEKPGYVVPVIFVFAWQSSETTTRTYTDGWRGVVVTTDVGMLVFFGIADQEVHRHVFLLKRLPSETRLSLLPPFFTTWDRYGGYAFAGEGDHVEALRAVDGKVSVAGVRLDAPDASYDLVKDVLVRRTTPGVGALVLLAVVLVALLHPRHRF